MTNIYTRGEVIRRFILEHIEKHPTDIAKLTAQHFSITRQAVSLHLKKLISEHILIMSGQTQNRTYQLCPLVDWEKSYTISSELTEHQVWQYDVRPLLGQLPENVLKIWAYGFTEMFNNAIDHSGGTKITILITKTAKKTMMYLIDNGIGIFKKIQMALNLLDESHAIFELSKGKLTTDPKNHSGEGIFFTSRMFDAFNIVSGGISFMHEFESPEDWILPQNRFKHGTIVWMEINNHTSRTTRKIFDEYTDTNEDYGFNKTVVPVKLAQYGDDQLVSRSQAKRLLDRVELFKTVMFDFSGVTSIGQSFADEIFRVFANKHPEITLIPIHTTKEVEQMISRAKSVKL